MLRDQKQQEQAMGTPYKTKKGIKIGSAYYQKLQRYGIDSDASLLQDALLRKDTGRREFLTEGRMTAFMLAMIVVVVSCIAAGWL
jgi:hypothetical protein